MDEKTDVTVSDLLPAYALGALDDAEVTIVAARIDADPAIARELRDLEEVAASLAFAAPPATPPVGGRAALLARVASEGHTGLTTIAGERGPLRLARPRHLPGRRLRIFGGVLAAVLVLSLLVWGLALQRQLGQEERRTAALEARTGELALVDRLLNDPMAAHPVSGPPVAAYGGLPAAGFVYIEPQGTIGLMLTYWLPTIEPDQRFQVWLVTPDGHRDSGGLFSADAKGNAHVIIRAPEPFATYSSVGVTIEPASGSAWPTSPRVCGGEIR